MRKILLWVAAGLFAIVALVIGISVLSAQSQINHKKTIATTFVNKVLSDDTDGAYGMFSSTAQSSQSREDWGTQVDQLSAFFKGQKATVQSTQTTGTHTEVSLAITGSDGNYIMTVTLIKDGSDFKVLSFTSQLKA